MHVEIFTLKIVHRYHLLSIPIMRKRLAFMAGLSDVPDMMRQVKFSLACISLTLSAIARGFTVLYPWQKLMKPTKPNEAK